MYLYKHTHAHISIRIYIDVCVYIYIYCRRQVLFMPRVVSALSSDTMLARLCGVYMPGGVLILKVQHPHRGQSAFSVRTG